MFFQSNRTLKKSNRGSYPLYIKRISYYYSQAATRKARITKARIEANSSRKHKRIAYMSNRY